MNRLKLEYQIKLNNLSIGEYCRAIGISTSAYYRKVQGKSEFTQSEITKSVEILHLDSPLEIFFDDLVS